MVKNINKLYFDKNVYDSNVESGEEIKFLGKKPMKISQKKLKLLHLIKLQDLLEI